MNTEAEELTRLLLEPMEGRTLGVALTSIISTMVMLIGASKDLSPEEQMDLAGQIGISTKAALQAYQLYNAPHGGQVH